MATTYFSGGQITLKGFLTAAVTGAISGAVTFGVSSWVSSICNFSSTAVGFTQGFVQGAVKGFVTGITNAAFNTVVNGGSLKLGDMLKAGLMSAGIGGIIGGIQGEKNYREVYNACIKMGIINIDDPVPATDEFLKQAQKIWFPDAPMENVTEFSVENLSDKAKKIFANEPNAKAITLASFNKQDVFSGKSAVFFNSKLAFTSAKELYFTMGHELVHVSQYSVLATLGFTRTDYLEGGRKFSDMLEYYGYGYAKSLGSSSLNVVNDFENVIYYKQMDYTNFSWTKNTNFTYPLPK